MLMHVYVVDRLLIDEDLSAVRVAAAIRPLSSRSAHENNDRPVDRHVVGGDEVVVGGPSSNSVSASPVGASSLVMDAIRSVAS